MSTRSDGFIRKISTPFVLAAGALALVGVALTFGSSFLEVAKVAIPHQLALKTAQLGLAVPAAQAASMVTDDAGYLPARLAIQAQVEQPLPAQF
jgi:hypothetical protein